jgi:hypothetical protein
MPLGERNGTSLLKEREVCEIRRKYLTGNYSFSELARSYKISKATVQMILEATNWAWLLEEGEAEALAEVRAERATR